MLRRKVNDRNVDFDAALNETLRAGLSAEKAELTRRFTQKTYSCGPEKIDLTKALSLADAMADEETLRKMGRAEQR